MKHHSMEDLPMELLIDHGPDTMLRAFTAAYNKGMKVEHECFIGAGRYERAEGRRAFAKASSLVEVALNVSPRTRGGTLGRSAQQRRHC